MRKPLFFICLLAVALSAFSCKSEFEKVRTSNNPDRILETADRYYKEGKYAKAQSLYELVVNALRGDPRLQEAYFKYANTFFQTKQYILASAYFKNYADTYTVAEDRKEAQYLEAMSYVRLSPDYRLDQEYTIKAIMALEQYANTYPQTERMEQLITVLDELRAKLETKEFEAARLYFDMKQYQAAVQSFERVLQDYPDSDRAETIRFRIAESHIQLADNSVISKRRERYSEATEAIEVYLRKFPRGEYAAELKGELKRIKQLLKTNENYVRY